TTQLIGSKDAQKLAEEARQQVNAEEDGESDQSGKVGPSDTPSSSIADEDLDKTFQKLKELAGKYGVDSAEGFKGIRRKAKQGSAKMLKLRRVMKQMVRICSAPEGSDTDILYSNDEEY
ncbi:hypothetical protein BGZ50_009616, partial [Haplosporangium sp. Z 11]